MITSYFLKQCGLPYLPIACDGSLMLPLALHGRSTGANCFDYVPSWQGFP
jgi:hypothetical protein